MARKIRNDRKKRYPWITGLLLIIVLTVASGIIQGRMSNRWGPSHDLLAAGELLQKIPETFNNWRMTDSGELSQRVLTMLQCTGHILRTYVNPETQESVHVSVLMGPSLPMASHTPDICMPSRAYEPVTAPQPIEIAFSGGSNQGFRRQTFESRDPAGGMLRAYWGWYADGSWSAPENYRFGFADEPFLYKIQADAHLPFETESEPDSTDAVQTFLTDFLPVISPYLVSAEDR